MMDANVDERSLVPAERIEGAIPKSERAIAVNIAIMRAFASFLSHPPNPKSAIRNSKSPPCHP